MEETMRLSSRKHARLWAAISAVLLGLSTAPAHAQVIGSSSGNCACPYPATIIPVPVPITGQPSPTPPSPPTTTLPTTPSPTGITPTPSAQAQETPSPFATPERFAALGGTTGVASDTGYID